MHVAEIDPVMCDRSPACPVARVCLRGAVERGPDDERGSTWVVDQNTCTGCGACVRVCPMAAVAMHPTVTPGR